MSWAYVNGKTGEVRFIPCMCMYCNPESTAFDPTHEPGAHHAADCEFYRSPFVGTDDSFWDQKLRARLSAER